MQVKTLALVLENLQGLKWHVSVTACRILICNRQKYSAYLCRLKIDFVVITGALAMEKLHRQVLPFILRRLKEDVLNDLPPKIIQDYYCDLSPLQVMKSNHVYCAKC